MITYLEDSSDTKVEEMAPKSNQSLRELIRGRNKVSTPPEVNKSKPPVKPPSSPSSTPCWSWAKAKSWAEEEETARGS